MHDLKFVLQSTPLPEKWQAIYYACRSLPIRMIHGPLVRRRAQVQVGPAAAADALAAAAAAPTHGRTWADEHGGA